ncbi:hypothetical protein BJ742DRAFT_232181 [Cladochytrium replicatum]|nr:hypothetical protein BJ742DRAFT_232181 [Cladochytrium replicatum]
MMVVQNCECTYHFLLSHLDSSPRCSLVAIRLIYPPVATVPAIVPALRLQLPATNHPFKSTLPRVTLHINRSDPTRGMLNLQDLKTTAGRLLKREGLIASSDTFALCHYDTCSTLTEEDLLSLEGKVRLCWLTWRKLNPVHLVSRVMQQSLLLGQDMGS